MRHVFYIVALVLFAQTASGQETYQLDSSSTISIQGTSTLHDWEMTFDTVSGTGIFEIVKGKIRNVSEVNIELRSRDLKSGKDGMDENAYKALKAEDFPRISYQLDKVLSIEQEKGQTKINTEGTLLVIDLQKTVSLPVLCRNTDEGIRCFGKLDTQITSFKIDPPTALFGSIETDDDISIDFDLIFVR